MEMMDKIRKAFREEVANLTWIDEMTRPKVYEKVELFPFILLKVYVGSMTRKTLTTRDVDQENGIKDGSRCSSLLGFENDFNPYY